MGRFGVIFIGSRNLLPVSVCSEDARKARGFASDTTPVYSLQRTPTLAPFSGTEMPQTRSLEIPLTAQRCRRPGIGAGFIKVPHSNLLPVSRWLRLISTWGNLGCISSPSQGRHLESKRRQQQKTISKIGTECSGELLGGVLKAPAAISHVTGTPAHLSCARL